MNRLLVVTIAPAWVVVIRLKSQIQPEVSGTTLKTMALSPPTKSFLIPNPTVVRSDLFLVSSARVGILAMETVAGFQALRHLMRTLPNVVRFLSVLRLPIPVLLPPRLLIVG